MAIILLFMGFTDTACICLCFWQNFIKHFSTVFYPVLISDVFFLFYKYKFLIKKKTIYQSAKCSWEPCEFFSKSASGKHHLSKEFLRGPTPCLHKNWGILNHFEDVLVKLLEN